MESGGQHLMIPVLPVDLMDAYVQAPIPFLFGIPAVSWKKVGKNLLNEVLVFDLGQSTLELIRVRRPFATLCHEFQCIPATESSLVPFTRLGNITSPSKLILILIFLYNYLIAF